MLDQLTSYQISEWEAFDKIDPIGEWRADFRGAKVESLILNLVQSIFAKKGAQPTTTTALDFMPNWTGEEDDPKVQSVEEQKRILLDIAGSQNKRVRQSKPPTKKTKKP